MREKVIFEHFGYDLPLEERCRLIKQAGFDGVMLWWGGPEEISFGEKCSRQDLAGKHGLFIEKIHARINGVNSLWQDNIDHRDFVGCIKDSIDDCSRFDIPVMVMHLTTGSICPPVNNFGLDGVRDILHSAEDKGIMIAIENIRDTDHTDHIFTNIKSDMPKFCFDSGHENCWTPSKDNLSLYGDKLAALHLHDNNGPVFADDSTDQHLLPFDGNINWEKITGKLKEIKYTGSISLEVFSTRYGDNAFGPSEFLMLAHERVKNCRIK